MFRTFYSFHSRDSPHPMIELEMNTGRGFVYGKEKLQKLEAIPNLKFKNLNYEKTGECGIYSFDVESYPCPTDQIELQKMNGLRCIHGNEIDFKEIHRLPQEGWQELIDCWSCHDNEFKGMLDLRIKPRRGGILVSNFYLLADMDALPKCCKTKTKLFYNEISGGLTVAQLIFKFFEEHFETKSQIVLNLDGRKYEIKLFYRCILVRENERIAFKVGFRETDKPHDEDSYIGEYFKREMIKQLRDNEIGISAIGYMLSFITQ